MPVAVMQVGEVLVPMQVAPVLVPMRVRLAGRIIRAVRVSVVLVVDVATGVLSPKAKAAPRACRAPSGSGSGMVTMLPDAGEARAPPVAAMSTALAA